MRKGERSQVTFVREMCARKKTVVDICINAFCYSTFVGLS